MPIFKSIFIIFFCFLLLGCEKNDAPQESSDEVVAIVDVAEAVSIDEMSPVEDERAESIQSNEREGAASSLYAENVISQDELKLFFESIFDQGSIELYVSSWECFDVANSETINFLENTLGMFSCTNSALEYMLKTDIEKENTLRKEGITQAIEEYESNVENGFMPSTYNDLFPVKILWERHEDQAFSYVNQNAIRWLRQNVIPSPDMEISGVPAQDLYDHILKNFCRSMMFYYLYLHNELDIDKELRWYNRMMDDADASAAGAWLNFRYNQQQYPQPGISMSEKQTPAYFIGFWLRRNIDNSDLELQKGLQQILQQYDPIWLEKLNQQFQ